MKRTADIHVEERTERICGVLSEQHSMPQRIPVPKKASLRHAGQEAIHRIIFDVCGFVPVARRSIACYTDSIALCAIIKRPASGIDLLRGRVFCEGSARFFHLLAFHSGRQLSVLELHIFERRCKITGDRLVQAKEVIL